MENKDLKEALNSVEQQAYNAFMRGVTSAAKDASQGGAEEGETMMARKRSRSDREAPASPAEDLTDNQEEVLRAIQDYMDEHGESPLYEELIETTGKSGIGNYIKTLEVKGWVSRDPDKFKRKLSLQRRL